MNINIRRIVSSFFVLSIAAAGLAIPAPAHGQTGVQRVAEGTHQWGQDNWCYVVQGGRWVRTSYFRRFPDPRNYPQVYDIYQNGRFIQRVGASAPVQTQAQGAYRQPSAAEIQLQAYTNELNRQIALANAQAARGTAPIAAGTGNTIGGFGVSVRNPVAGSTTIGGDFSRPGLPGMPVYVGGARTLAEAIAAMTGANWRTPFLDPNCAASNRGC